MKRLNATLNQAKQSVVPFEKNVMCMEIGNFTIRPYQHGGFWLENGRGEGMQVRDDALAAVLEAFWKESF